MQYSKDRQLGKKTTTAAGASVRAQTQIAQGFWADGDSEGSSEPILEVSSSRRMPQPQPVLAQQHTASHEPASPPSEKEKEKKPRRPPLPDSKNVLVRDLPLTLWDQLVGSARKHHHSVNAEILSRLEQSMLDSPWIADG